MCLSTGLRFCTPERTAGGYVPISVVALSLFRRSFPWADYRRGAESGRRRECIFTRSVSMRLSRPFTWLDGELYGETRRLGDVECESGVRARLCMGNGRAIPSRCQNRIGVVRATGKRHALAPTLTLSVCADPPSESITILGADPGTRTFVAQKRQVPPWNLPSPKRIRPDRATARKRHPAPLPNTPYGASTPVNPLQ